MSNNNKYTCAFFGCTETEHLRDLTPLDVPEGQEVEACPMHYEAVLQELIEDGHIMEKPAEERQYDDREGDDEEEEGAANGDYIDNGQHLEGIIGPSAKYSEHKAGETIRFRAEGGRVKTGTILHVRAPGPAIVGGQVHGIIYTVDTDEGFPAMVRPGDVIE